jgi:hypothetical protein
LFPDEDTPAIPQPLSCVTASPAPGSVISMPWLSSASSSRRGNGFARDVELGAEYTKLEGAEPKDGGYGADTESEAGSALQAWEMDDQSASC